MKRRNGFTLIELLAVIVILAIIAVIAVPIVINIIDDSKKNASLRSADFYLDAVEMSVAQATLKNKNIEDKTYNILENGNICLEDYNSTSKKCVDSSDEGTDVDILEVEVNGEHPKEGTITINNGNISNVDFEISENRVIKNDKGEIIYFPCTLISGEENTIGSKYECEVSPGTKYNFYVLSTMNVSGEIITDETEDKVVASTNLIMDRNMCSDGTPTDANKEDKCLVAWNDESDQSTNAYGPVTAMTYLHNATKSWINIPSLNYTYNDRNFQGIATDNTTIGYTSFVSNNGEATITALDGTTITPIGSKTEPLKARMPIYTYNSTNSSKNEVSLKQTDNSNIYLYDYLAQSGTIQTNKIDGIYGYWTLSSLADYSDSAWYVDCSGNMFFNNVAYVGDIGVRAVINLKL